MAESQESFDMDFDIDWDVIFDSELESEDELSSGDESLPKAEGETTVCFL